MSIAFHPSARRSGSATTAASWLRPAAASRVKVRGLRELALLAVLYIGYSSVRLLADQDLASAASRAASLVRLEGLIGLDVEEPLNRWMTATPWLAVLASYWYSVLHYVVTPLVLWTTYRRHPGEYGRARTVLVAATSISLVLYLFIPTAPPRLMGGSWSDTLQTYEWAGWWSGHASAPGGVASLTNELAAMPSMHVGWAVWVAWQLAGRGVGWRRVGIAYALGTSLVVVGTGNHWVADAVAGAALIAAGIVVTSSTRRPRLGMKPRSHMFDCARK